MLLVEDLRKVYAYADAADRVMVLALLYTAGRRNEPLHWTWEEDVELKNRRICLGTSKTNDVLAVVFDTFKETKTAGKVIPFPAARRN